MGHQRYHDERADDVAPARRYAEGQFERIGHDGRFEGKEDEGERRVDQRRQGRADVAEARAPGQQIHVDAVAGRVQAHRQSGQEDDDPGRDDRQRRIDETVFDQQRGTDRLEHQKRRRAEGGIGDPQFRPVTETVGREAQRVILEGLAGDPGVVVAPYLDHPLQRIAAVVGDIVGTEGGGRVVQRSAADPVDPVDQASSGPDLRPTAAGSGRIRPHRPRRCRRAVYRRDARRCHS